MGFLNTWLRVETNYDVKTSVMGVIWGGDRGTCPPHRFEGWGTQYQMSPPRFLNMCVSPQKPYILINLD